MPAGDVQFSSVEQEGRIVLDLVTTTNAGEETVLKGEAVEQFRSSLRGELLHAGDAGYDEARSIWNGMIDKRPALIARATGVADVIEAVNFARTNDLLVSVRGGGHNVAGLAVSDGGLMIDLSLMKGVRVDPGARTARAQPGATLGDLDRETQAFGLAVPAGIVSTTGIAGLTLGGGIGWLSRKHGLTSDNLLSADIVTADGRFLTASEEENADLFWGLRGGGGNFGIVTSFEYRAHALGPMVVAGLILYPMDKATEFLRFYRDFVAAAPEELTATPLLRLAPAAPFLAPEVHGAPVVGVAVLYAGPIEDGQRAVQPLKAFGAPLVDLISPKPFMALQTMFDAAAPHGNQYYLKTEYLPGLSDDAIETIAAYGATITSPLSLAAFFHLGGAVSRVAEQDTAFSHRDAAFAMNIQASWLDPQESDEHIRWTRDFWEAMQPFSTGGVYVNFLSEDEGEDRVRAAYGATKYERLVALKNKYDPTNLFRLNQNIKPTV
jgi:FAD/FMN-containing dehydrogenase